MRKLLVPIVCAVCAVVISAGPAFAFHCTNADKNADAGLVTLKDSTACDHVDCDNGNARAWNSTGTGAWITEQDCTVFARNLLAPAMFVGSPDHGIVESACGGE